MMRYSIYLSAFLLADGFVGEVAEWSNASDLKSDEVKASGSSNLPLSVSDFDAYQQFRNIVDCNNY